MLIVDELTFRQAGLLSFNPSRFYHPLSASVPCVGPVLCLVSNEGLSEEVKQFIADCIASVEQLEVLLHLYSTAPRPWSAEAIAKDLYVAQESVTRRLEEFHEKGLLEKREGDLYVFRPQKDTTERVVRDLSFAYKERRVAVINQIFANPQDHLRSFSDAFKFKKSPR